MFIRPFAIFFCFLTLAVYGQPVRNKNSNLLVSKILTNFPVIDSLNKYIGANRLHNNNGLIFYSGRLNKQDMGIVQLSDNSSVICRKKINKWVIIDSFSHPISNVIATDLNADGKKDLLITYSVTASGANTENIVYMFNLRTNQFTHNKYYDLPNIRYDKTKRKILSAWWSGASRPQDKMTYIIKGDSLIFGRGVSYSPPGEKLKSNLYTVDFYTINKDKRLVTKKLTGSLQKMWDVFTNALWNSNRD